MAGPTAYRPGLRGRRRGTNRSRSLRTPRSGRVVRAIPRSGRPFLGRVRLRRTGAGVLRSGAGPGRPTRASLLLAPLGLLLVSPRLLLVSAGSLVPIAGGGAIVGHVEPRP